ncbi:Asp23/Gls24 family envelope stress response protein [Streptomyces tubbatahanensis]|uniref:Asp23/Gls24 family envelope stress response protein n=1 Tax=Streptomyces tubbatahanensis TaxID=2923272 RepID=A0ABY3XPC2_9ACTN|nr:Asp23/Gls24 family envelope stress response protein [Streptomyces tubbatahanensis]UNS96307.1 Asp23/Gls24 family envelope stress response protein [Streptomyces tubbatahanensis]
MTDGQAPVAGRLPQSERVGAAERGATRIADRVVAKVAAQAAREALRAHRDETPGRSPGPAADEDAGRVPGAGSGSSSGQEGGQARSAVGGGGPVVGRPVRRTSVTVRERTARVRMALELRYPSDLGAQCGAVRRRVIARVRELVGMEVPDVALQIDRLHSAHLKGDGSGRVT